VSDEPIKHENTVVFLVTPGDMLDERWLIEGRIGQGAMGSVFKGSDQQQPRKVAIKILAPEHCRKPKVLARFEREAKLMSTLRHQNIIQILGVGRRGALPYIVMPFLEGMTLAEVVKLKGGKLTPGETLWMVKQISSGLTFVHHHGLVHRDVKPQNIFVSPGGRVTILDLGVVRDKSNPGLTKPGAMVGTPYYMSPEQIQGTGEIDKRTDVYSLAAMTFELLTGRPPFLGTSNFEVLYAHKNNPPPDANALNDKIPKVVAAALAKAMSKKPDDRPGSASEFYADLEAFIGGQEKVDPKVAFAFLDKAAAEAKEKEKEKARKKKAGVVPSTRAATVSIARPDAVPEGKRGTNTAMKPLESKTRPTEPKSAEIPMAASADVSLLNPTPTGESITQAVAPSDTLAGAAASHDSEDDGPAPSGATHDDGEGEDGEHGDETQGLDQPEVAARARVTPRGGGKNPAAETSDDASQSLGASATVTESGELRIITTLKGLTSTAALFIDGKAHGSTPLSLQLPVGKHTVRVEKSGHRHERAAVVKSSEVTLVRIELAAAK
jgi:eukaryotic-like serine/threonine-protein kinase